MIKLVTLACMFEILANSTGQAIAQEPLIRDGSVRTLPCKVIEFPTQRITVCAEDKGIRTSRDPACGFVEAGLCWGNTVTAPLMVVALPIVKAAKDKGMFRDLGECEEVARDVGRLGGILGAESAIAGVIAGACGECVCRAAY
ncbi:hypothetical protein GFL58_30745 [Rhizobium leguminosarum bv. viciae]|uniref:hypothetical protein n=1 Tax=Rhizobium leguminosarum TaxID=384 RepID=UPI00143F14BC|nr:hypothetical protein [Rhizobium leguminosarum]NKM65297.1 hypothetical protein [Rhizobium leguminosarum bv. viciae]